MLVDWVWATSTEDERARDLAPLSLWHESEVGDGLLLTPSPSAVARRAEVMRAAELVLPIYWL